MPNVKHKKRFLKAARGKVTVTYKRVPIRLSADFSKETYRQEGARKKYSKLLKTRTYIQDYSIQENYHLEWKSR